MPLPFSFEERKVLDRELNRFDSCYRFVHIINKLNFPKMKDITLRSVSFGDRQIMQIIDIACHQSDGDDISSQPVLLTAPVEAWTERYRRLMKNNINFAKMSFEKQANLFKGERLGEVRNDQIADNQNFASFQPF